jgi:leader peptidase (prepilin peptidase)/N-methyltransferase
MLGWYAILAGLGLSLGSFLSVCNYRLPRGLSVVTPGSFCPACGEKLAWREIIPLVSYVWLGGRCSHCSVRIPFIYPIVETLGAMIVLGSFLIFGMSVKGVLAGTFALGMLSVGATDYLHFFIPDKSLLAILAVGVFVTVLNEPLALASAVGDGISTFAAAFALFLMGRFWLGKPALGYGDVKLSGVVGFFLGFTGFIVALWIAALLGIGFACARKVSHPCRHLGHRDPRLPLGTFLAISSVIVLVLEEPIYQLLERVWTLMY